MKRLWLGVGSTGVGSTGVGSTRAASICSVIFIFHLNIRLESAMLIEP